MLKVNCIENSYYKCFNLTAFPESTEVLCKNILKGEEFIVNHQNTKERKWIIGNNIRTARRAKNISQELLVEKCDLSVSMIQKVEAGQTTLSMEKFIILLDFLNISADAVLNRGKNCQITTELIYSILEKREEREVSFILDMVEKLLEAKDYYLQ